MLAALGLVSPAAAQSVYDFNGLNGSNTHPYIPLDQQDGWSEQTYRASNRCGVTATLSHDGTQSLQFEEVGPGYGCDASRINDPSWGYAQFTGTEASAYFQADMRVAVRSRRRSPHSRSQVGPRGDSSYSGMAAS